MITRIRSDVNLRVPDLGVSCTADAPGQQALPDPILLIEILSPSNTRERWDNVWDNVWSYTTIPSVREIAVVHSTRLLVEMLRRGADGHWPEGPEEVGPDGSLRLQSIGFACWLRDVYAQTYPGVTARRHPAARHGPGLGGCAAPLSTPRGIPAASWAPHTS